MAFENFPAPQQQATPNPRRDWRNPLLAILIIALLGTWGYIIWKNNQSKETIQQKDTVIATTSSQKDELQRELDEATSRYDQIKTGAANMAHSKDSVISNRDRDIRAKRDEIRRLLSKDKASAEEIAQAKSLIRSLNSDIDSYRSKIETLEGEKIVLTQEKNAITQERDEKQRSLDSAQIQIKEKEALLDIGSTLHASNFSILGISERNGQEKETSTAKRVDKLRISFDLDENRITQTGVKNIYVCITGPDGAPITSGQFDTREGQKFFTQKVDINYTQGQRQTVSFDWRKGNSFQTGDYHIEVYNNGFKIGEGIRTLKKGGIFG